MSFCLDVSRSHFSALRLASLSRDARTQVIYSNYPINAIMFYCIICNGIHFVYFSVQNILYRVPHYRLPHILKDRPTTAAATRKTTQMYEQREKRPTGVYAGVGGGDTKLWLYKLGDEGDEGGDDGTLCRVGQADEQEGHVAEDPQGCLGEVWGGRQDRARCYSGSTTNAHQSLGSVLPAALSSLIGVMRRTIITGKLEMRKSCLQTVRHNYLVSWVHSTPSLNVSETHLHSPTMSHYIWYRVPSFPAGTNNKTSNTQMPFDAWKGKMATSRFGCGSCAFLPRPRNNPCSAKPAWMRVILGSS